MNPSGFARKIYLPKPNLAILCAGDADRAKELATEAWSRFENTEVTDERALQLVRAYQRDDKLSAIVAYLLGGVYYRRAIGSIAKHDLRLFGKNCLVGGTGTTRFVDFCSRQQGPTPSPLAFGDDVWVKHPLLLVSNFLADELHFGSTIRANFGGGFEFLFATDRAFERVDDIVYAFMFVDVDGDGRADALVNPVMLRQWYQDDCLYIYTSVDFEAHRAGFSEPGVVIAAGMLSDPCPAPELPRWQPSLVCIHVTYRLHNGMRQPQTISSSGNLHLEFTFNAGPPPLM